MSATKITDENFKKEVLDNQGVVMLDCYATWCGPCKMMAPIIEDFSEKYKETIKICKMDIEECFSITYDYNISAVPTILFFKNGQVISRFVGLRSKNNMEKDIEEAIKHD